MKNGPPLSEAPHNKLCRSNHNSVMKLEKRVCFSITLLLSGAHEPRARRTSASPRNTDVEGAILGMLEMLHQGSLVGAHEHPEVQGTLDHSLHRDHKWDMGFNKVGVLIRAILLSPKSLVWTCLMTAATKSIQPNTELAGAKNYRQLRPSGSNRDVVRA